MVVIFTDYDRVSRMLKACALQLVKKANRRIKVKLGPSSSSAATVQKTLGQEREVALFFFGHGELPPDGLVGQDQASAVHAKNLALLKNRLVFAASCYSAQSLAGAAKRYGATVIGYRDELRISFRPEDRKRQQQCVLAAALSVLDGADASSAQANAANEFQKAAESLITGSVADQIIAASVFRNNALGIQWFGKNRKM